MTQIENPAFQLPAFQVPLASCHAEQPVRPVPESEVFGTLFFEVILSQSTPPILPGWTLRLWPQARLGDATLEARQEGQGDLSELVSGLQMQGVDILGPIRRKGRQEQRDARSTEIIDADHWAAPGTSNIQGIDRG